jgi:hypothetical protein
MFQLRDYQVSLSDQMVDRLNKHGLVYLAAGVRTGKTHTSLTAAQKYGAQKVLFLTKIIAIQSIQSDYRDGQYPFELVIINHQSMHKVIGEFDLLIVDEAHQHSAFPKPSKSTKEIKTRFGHLPMILMSGTPTPESFSQWYHQFSLSNKSPFRANRNFYKWAELFVKKYSVNLGYGIVYKYDRAIKEKIDPLIEPYLLTFTQQEAGFKSKITEHVMDVEMSAKTYKLIETLKKDFVITGNSDTVTADSAVKLMSKVHQLGSGTIILDSGKGITIDKTKALFVKDQFSKQKIGIFYKFKQEWELLKEVFGEKLTNDLNEFNTTDKNIALQIQSGREGISLKQADCLVFFSIDFSAVSFWQGTARTQTIDRLETDVYWIFSKETLDESIYKRVMSKKKYTTQHFLKEHGIKFSKQADSTTEK